MSNTKISNKKLVEGFCVHSLLPLEPSRHKYRQLQSAVWCVPDCGRIQDHRSEREMFDVI